MNSTTLRRSLRKKRRDIPTDQRTALDQSISFHLIHSRLFTRSQRIGAYLANDGEVNLISAIETALHRGKRCFLPALSPLKEKYLWFCQFNDDQKLKLNQFGIEEPVPNAHNRIALHKLDVVLLPLVGFDDYGTRIGMGGGYYDRSFSFRKPRQHWRKPFLVGVAYEQQRCKRLEREKWDIPLDAVVTESGIHYFSSNDL